MSSSSLAIAPLVVGLLATSLALAQTPASQAPSTQAPSTQAPSTQAPSAKKASSAKAPAAQPTTPSAAKTKAAPSKPAGPPSHYLPNRFAGRAGAYYRVVWGVDSLSVKWAESGELIRFSWRVLDPQKAQVLSDKKAEPALIDPKAGVSLVVPTLEKIGQMRQSQAPEAGRSYWMAFSNKGRLVKRGDHVDVVIGPFRAENLGVD